MCTLAVFTRVFDELPLLVAANRDEFLDRPTAAPGLLRDHPRLFGGRDLRAGGSWLVLSERGLVVGLLNRRGPVAAAQNKPSRGRLPLLLAAAASIDDALLTLQEDAVEHYDPFRILLADRERACIAANLPGGLRLEWLEPGVHVLTNISPDDGPCSRLHFCASGMEAVAGRWSARPGQLEALVADLRRVLSEHREAENEELFARPCMHLGDYGTRSSSVVALGQTGRARWFHTESAPCQDPLLELPLPWHADREPAV